MLLYIHWILLCFLYVWSACFWKRSGNNPPFSLWFCLFLLFTLSSMFQSYVLLPFLNFDVYIFVKGASHYNHENSLFNSICVEFSSVQLLSCIQLFVIPWTTALPGLPVHHRLLEFTQTHVHWVADSIQTSHPLSSHSPAFSLSQHQCLFKWVSSSHQAA